MANDSAENEKGAPLTAGQRLAAARAAKSARKAAEKGRQAELVEDKAIAQAAIARDWLQENLKPLGLMAGGVLIVAALGIGWSSLSESKITAAGSELAAVLDADDEATLATSYAAVAESHPKTLASAWARIGEGRALYGQGRYEQSRQAYQAALETAEDEVVRWVALEGIAYALESEKSYDQAIEQLEALHGLGKNVAPIAGYHQARLLLAQGKLEEAKTKLEGVLHDLRQPDAPFLPFTRAQAEARLSLIDPSLAPAQDDPRRLEEFIRQQNERLGQQGRPTP